MAFPVGLSIFSCFLIIGLSIGVISAAVVGPRRLESDLTLNSNGPEKVTQPMRGLTPAEFLTLVGLLRHNVIGTVKRHFDDFADDASEFLGKRGDSAGDREQARFIKRMDVTEFLGR